MSRDEQNVLVVSYGELKVRTENSEVRQVSNNLWYSPRMLVPCILEICQKSVKNVSENCHLLKSVRKLSEMCQKTVRNLSVPKKCRKTIRFKSIMYPITVRIMKCVTNVSLRSAEICQNSVKLTTSDRFLTYF